MTSPRVLVPLMFCRSRCFQWQQRNNCDGNNGFSARRPDLVARANNSPSAELHEFAGESNGQEVRRRRAASLFVCSARSLASAGNDRRGVNNFQINHCEFCCRRRRRQPHCVNSSPSGGCHAPSSLARNPRSVGRAHNSRGANNGMMTPDCPSAPPVQRVRAPIERADGRAGASLHQRRPQFSFSLCPRSVCEHTRPSRTELS